MTVCQSGLQRRLLEQYCAKMAAGWMGTLMSDLWYQDQVSLDAKRDSLQEASPVALIVTRYSMTKYIRETRREGSLPSPLDISDSRIQHETTDPLDE